MRHRIVFKAIKKFDATIKSRELVAEIQAEMKEKIGQISESGMEKLAVRLGEAQLELAQLRLKLVPWYDGRDKYALRKALKHSERELANLNVYLSLVNKPGKKPPRGELHAFREAQWSDLMRELVDNENAAWTEQEQEQESESAMAT